MLILDSTQVSQMMNISQPLTLPNQQVIKNRIAKAAMEENMASNSRNPSQAIFNLYQAWSEGGTGLIITGNVMVDANAMTGPGGIVLDKHSDLSTFKHWAQVAQQNNTQCWMQINHPGRQVPKDVNETALAPSAIKMNLGEFTARFANPVAMTQEDIERVIEQFTTTAKLAEQSGFRGVEVHAAHGYLLSQFLSPLSNQREDQWGGSLDNRARLLLEIIKNIKAQTQSDFSVAVKLNTADFQKGGFSEADALYVIQALEALNVDLIELSGGSYEAPAMQGQSRDGRTLAREAYFLELVESMVNKVNVPLMITGGIRRLAIAEQVISSGIAMAGMATALAIDPSLTNKWIKHLNEQASAALKPITWKNKTLASVANMAQVRMQLRRLSKGKSTQPNRPYWLSLIQDQLANKKNIKAYKAHMAKRDLV